MLEERVPKELLRVFSEGRMLLPKMQVQKLSQLPMSIPIVIYI
jgi:hypothetical protein